VQFHPVTCLKSPSRHEWNYSAAVSPAFWKIRSSKERLARRAIDAGRDVSMDTSGGSVTNANIALPRATRFSTDASRTIPTIPLRSGVTRAATSRAKGYSDKMVINPSPFGRLTNLELQRQQRKEYRHRQLCLEHVQQHDQRARPGEPVNSSACRDGDHFRHVQSSTNNPMSACRSRPMPKSAAIIQTLTGDGRFGKLFARGRAGNVCAIQTGGNVPATWTCKAMKTDHAAYRKHSAAGRR